MCLNPTSSEKSGFSREEVVRNLVRINYDRGKRDFGLIAASINDLFSMVESPLSPVTEAEIETAFNEVKEEEVEKFTQQSLKTRYLQ